MSVTTLPLVLIVFTSMLIICRMAKPNTPLAKLPAQTIIVTQLPNTQRRHSSIAPRSPHHISLPTTIHILYTLNCFKYHQNQYQYHHHLHHRPWLDQQQFH